MTLFYKTIAGSEQRARNKAQGTTAPESITAILPRKRQAPGSTLSRGYCCCLLTLKAWAALVLPVALILIPEQKQLPYFFKEKTTENQTYKSRFLQSMCKGNCT